jgi:3-dehydroquinate synthase
MQIIKLTTPNGATDITVGEDLSAGLNKLKPVPVLLVDEHVLCQHYELFKPFSCITVPSGERNKTLETVESIYHKLVELEVDRSSLLVGVGGGLATDLVGYAASTFLREVPFGFISSTLLGQVDASIGGKNGVNLDRYKNMIGTIRQPSFVWADLSLLETLSRKEYVSGIAEVIKYGAIMDREFFDYLAGHMHALLDMDKGVLEEVVTVSAKIKVDIVQQDEKESGLRRLLNFGHTIGHSIEREKQILHGEAVSIGMVMAAKLSNSMGLMSSSDVDMLEKLIASAGLPVFLDLDPNVIFDNIQKDKKRSGEQIHFILLETLGKAIVRTIPIKDLKSILHDLC